MIRALSTLLTLGSLQATEWKQPVPVTTAVLVHGIWENEHRAFRGLREQLENRGVRCIVPSLRPATAHHGLAPLAAQLDAAVANALAPGERCVVIAYSMGGLVSRHWLQHLGGIDRCDAFITISTPHHGTRMAFAHPGRGAAEMRPDSGFIAALAETEDRLAGLPIASYRTPWDGVIVPSVNSIWQLATNIEIPCFLHARMTNHPALHADLFQRLATPRPEAPSPTAHRHPGPRHRDSFPQR